MSNTERNGALTSTYVPGNGYTIRNARGHVLARNCTPAQRDAWLAYGSVGALSQQLLDALKTA